MKITTREYVNDRTSDGRVYSAGAGAVTLVDDSDQGMCDLMRSLAGRGLVDIEEDSPRETVDKTAAAPAAAKKATSSPKVATDE